MAARTRLKEYEKKRDFGQTNEPSGRKRTKRAPAKKVIAKKATAKKATAKKATAKKATAKKATAKKATAKKATAKKAAPIFVVQHHRASHDHHDFRLEHDGVLLSWAVPKHVPRTYGVRRLAVQVEDHPLDYATFVGTIPEGNYGAGTVERYDMGTYEPEGDIDEGLEKGKLSFTLHGDKLKGDWTLVRMAPRDGESPRKPQWLLMRHHKPG